MEEYSPTRAGIKLWAEDDRPREKMILKGKVALSDAELVAILLVSGTRSESAVDVAKRILSSVENNLNALGRLSIKELMKFRGVGEAKAIAIVAALEIGRRRREIGERKNEHIASSRDAAGLFLSSLSDLSCEEFWILMLNRSNKIIRKHLVSTGGLSGTVVDPRIIFKHAIEHLAASLILCHNHPSGNIRPSKEDIELTKKMKEAGRVLDIPVIDHLIIGGNAYFSFADEGIL